jgi:hypothetical protein
MISIRLYGSSSNGCELCSKQDHLSSDIPVSVALQLSLYPQPAFTAIGVAASCHHEEVCI